MPKLKWGGSGEKKFESGLDRGVIYYTPVSLEGPEEVPFYVGETAFPWNGLLEVSENYDTQVEAIYASGVQIGTETVLGDFTATIRAYTYPEILETLTGNLEINVGVYLKQQFPKPFSMSYRTRVGNDISGEADSYKIHILYNLIAVPTGVSYETSGEDPSAVEFEWDVMACPDGETLYGRPSSYIVIDTKKVDPLLLQELEMLLYGSQVNNAFLPSYSQLVEYLATWYRISITDNNDGTWTAESKYEGYIFVNSDGTFTIENANAIYIDENSYTITGTKTFNDTPTVTIIDNQDGTWSASTSNSALIQLNNDDTFSLSGVTVEILDENTYSVSDTN
jgi:hypothetical protein